MAGRDIGTVIFPDAFVKVYLNASPGVRAHRRAVERGVAGDEAATIEQELTRRDQDDQTRTAAPLRAAPDAVVVDTDHLAIPDVIHRILEIVQATGVVIPWRTESPTHGT
jgi:cytidylate kinase